MNYSKIIKRLRDKLFFSQQDMADYLNVSFSSVNRWENGHYEPTIKTKRKIHELCVEYDIKERDDNE